MRTMKYLALVCVAAVSLSACGGSDTSASEAKAAADESTATASTAPAKDLIGDDDFRARCVNVKGEAALKVVEPACAYLAALLSHDGSNIPVATDAWRLEQGVNTGKSGKVIQDDMSKSYSTTSRDCATFVGSLAATTKRSPTTSWI